MIPRSVLLTLVLALPVFVVLLALVLGGVGLSQAVGDPAGARALAWVGGSLAILLGANLILLVLALGVRALEDPADRGE